MAYDMLIKNGLIVDGSGMPSFHGDIGVKVGGAAASSGIAACARQATASASAAQATTGGRVPRTNSRKPSGGVRRHQKRSTIGDPPDGHVRGLSVHDMPGGRAR